MVNEGHAHNELWSFCCILCPHGISGVVFTNIDAKTKTAPNKKLINWFNNSSWIKYLKINIPPKIIIIEISTYFHPFFTSLSTEKIIFNINLIISRIVITGNYDLFVFFTIERITIIKKVFFCLNSWIHKFSIC